MADEAKLTTIEKRIGELEARFRRVGIGDTVANFSSGSCTNECTAACTIGCTSGCTGGCIADPVEFVEAGQVAVAAPPLDAGVSAYRRLVAG